MKFKTGILIILIAAANCWYSELHKATVKVAEKILEKRSHKDVYKFFNSLFTVKHDCCDFGFLYDDFARSSVHPDEFNSDYHHPQQHFCNVLKENGEQINHFTSQNAEENNLIEGIKDALEHTKSSIKGYLKAKYNKKGNANAQMNEHNKNRLGKIQKHIGEIEDKSKSEWEQLNELNNLRKSREETAREKDKEMKEKNKLKAQRKKAWEREKHFEKYGKMKIEENEEPQSEEEDELAHQKGRNKGGKKKKAKERKAKEREEKEREEIENAEQNINSLKPQKKEQEKIRDKIEACENYVTKAKYYAAVSLSNLVHLIGDLYQPNHNYSQNKPDGKSDKGGNERMVIPNSLVFIRGRNNWPSLSLHQLFDSGFAKKAKTDVCDIVKEVNSLKNPPSKCCSVKNAHEESVRIAKEEIYKPFERKHWTLDNKLIEQMQIIVYQQLHKAGDHIACYLDEIYDFIKQEGLL